MTTPIRITHISTRLYPQTFKHVIAQQDFGGGQVFAPYLLTSSNTEMSYTIHNSRLFPSYFPEAVASMISTTRADLYQLYLSIHDIPIMLPILQRAGVLSRTLIHINDYHPLLEKFADALQACRAIIVPSPAMIPQLASIVSSRVRVLFIPNACPARFVLPQEPHPLRSVCLAADVMDNQGEEYLNYTWAQQVCKTLDAPLHVYPTRVNHQVMYQYDMVMHPLPYHLMLRGLNRHMAGWAGASNDTHDIHTCCTNKFWDYLAARVVPVLYRSNAMRDILDYIAFSSGLFGENGEKLYVEIPDPQTADHNSAWFADAVDYARGRLDLVNDNELTIEKYLTLIPELV